jgi:hypothetical protein
MRVSLSGLFKRNDTPFSKQKNIFLNGADNAYPQRVERIINASVTAKSCANKLRSFIVGDGFADKALNEVVVYNDGLNSYTMYDVLTMLANDLAYYGGCAMNVGWNGKLKISDSRALLFKNIRIGKKDTNDYNGFYYYYDNWEKDKTKTYNENDIVKFYSFNPNDAVVVAQLKDKQSVGQVAMMKLDNSYVYPLSVIDCALEEADTETQIKTFKNTETRKGFFAKYILYHTEFANDAEYNDFKQTLKRFEGAECDSRILLVQGEFDKTTGELVQDMNIKLEKIEANIDDKLFETYEKSTSNNIRKAFFNIPSILVEQQEGSFFGSSGEAFYFGVKMYNADTKIIRDMLASFLEKLYKYSDNEYLAKAKYDIKPLSYE